MPLRHLGLGGRRTAIKGDIEYFLQGVHQTVARINFLLIYGFEAANQEPWLLTKLFII